jgi:tetratricopeptide (TPR) repeat protein
MRELDQAQAVGRSDADVLADRLDLLHFLAIRQSESGTPDWGVFRQADALFDRALALHPDDPNLWVQRMSTLYREGFIRLARGEDCRAWLRGQITRYQHMPVEARRADDGVPFWWLLGEAQWRVGVDPRPVLDAGIHRMKILSNEESEMRYIRARYLVEHGQDPLPDLDRAADICRRQAQTDPSYSYNHTVWGEVLLTRAQCLWDEGKDPSSAIRGGLQQLETSLSISPGVVYAYFHLSLLRALQARVALQKGQDPWPAVKAALKAAEEGVRIRASHFRSQLGLAEAHRVAALAEARRGGDPTPHLEAARKALAAGLALNPTDFRLHLAQARLDLDAATFGHGGTTALHQAEAAALKGLKVKADSPALWIALARARRLLGHPQGAQTAIQKALRLDPHRPAALAEARRLESRPSGQPASTART